MWIDIIQCSKALLCIMSVYSRLMLGLFLQVLAAFDVLVLLVDEKVNTNAIGYSILQICIVLLLMY